MEGDKVQCACGRLPGESDYWIPGMTLTRYDGTHSASQCQIDQLVTPDRPEQDELIEWNRRLRDESKAIAAILRAGVNEAQRFRDGGTVNVSVAAASILESLGEPDAWDFTAKLDGQTLRAFNFSVPASKNPRGGAA